MVRVIFLITIFLYVSDAAVAYPVLTGKASKASQPSIEYTYLPPFGSTDLLKGKTHNVNPANYKVAVYIFVEGAAWWTKPTLAAPLTVILSDSTWQCKIASAGSDVYAVQIAAYLLPNGVTPPVLSGSSDLPASLDTLAVASINVTRYGKTIQFSNQEWWLKKSLLSVGPGPNYFSDSTENVWVDQLGRLHLKITKRGSTWYCTEVISKKSFGYGKYTFDIDSKIGLVDKNAVCGIFTWDNASAQTHREIDLEFSLWGVDQTLNAQYVVQPYTKTGNIYRWKLAGETAPSRHSFEWRADSIYFLSLKGDTVIRNWSYKGTSNPSPGNENVRINFYLINGIPPADTTGLEVIISKFDFSNAPVQVANPGVQPDSRRQFTLLPNYPNPFNPSTMISYTIPKSGIVSLKVYNMLGKEVACLVNESKSPGAYTAQFNGADLPSGVYLYELRINELKTSHKMMLLK